MYLCASSSLPVVVPSRLLLVGLRAYMFLPPTYSSRRLAYLTSAEQEAHRYHTWVICPLPITYAARAPRRRTRSNLFAMASSILTPVGRTVC